MILNYLIIKKFINKYLFVYEMDSEYFGSNN